MLVARYMTPKPETITENDRLSDALAKMRAGGFRRLPVMAGEELVGIVTERDIRQHVGFLHETRVSGAMTEGAIVVAPGTSIDEAVEIMLREKIGGMPVVEDEKVVGILTTSDILRAFVDLMAARPPEAASSAH